ncbi:hypothetical protein EJ08DRAFT_585700 [Tothia fuscella]|uniref:RING-CH-type domain-containing protein n=1 Tax=Tothia fuscella TaxID=1048955 RepID=A0A9P4NU96_9PEZI|nr:hypothetical protein EJ08DRAFT_585700 [Tothia fuscella]
MASLPPSQRRHTPPQRRESEQSIPAPIEGTDSEAHSTISEDSQTVLLNPSKPQESRSSKESKEEQKTTPTSTPHAPHQEVDVRRCWICFTDETEDTPTSSEWRSPCPCALVAHESCLLDWIADMEAPNSRRQRSPRDKILCPQCKSEIVLARPRSYVVDAVRAIEISANKLVLPGALFVGVTSFWSLCWAHGAHSVYMVFGAEDAQRILEPLWYMPPGHLSPWQQTLSYIKTRWRLDLGLTLIPPILVCSRATIADGVLPILPMLFFVTKPDTDPLLDIATWPPSAGLSFALLPYLRSIYNTYYDRVWAERERRWLKEIQPRATTEGVEENEEPADNLAGEDNVLEINVMLDEWEEDNNNNDNANDNHNANADDNDNNDNEQEDGGDEAQAHPLNAPPLDDIGAAPAEPGIPAVAPAPDQARGALHNLLNGNFNLAFSTNRLAESVLGALAFPALSAAMGELLRLTLPKALTTRICGRGSKPTGLLQTVWGRSIVGGCTFVVLKDAVMLYVRWRMAQNHRMRKVVDYDRGKPGRSVPPGGSR